MPELLYSDGRVKPSPEDLLNGRGRLANSEFYGQHAMHEGPNFIAESELWADEEATLP